MPKSDKTCANRDCDNTFPSRSPTLYCPACRVINNRDRAREYQWELRQDKAARDALNERRRELYKLRRQKENKNEDVSN